MLTETDAVQTGFHRINRLPKVHAFHRIGVADAGLPLHAAKEGQTSVSPSFAIFSKLAALSQDFGGPLFLGGASQRLGGDLGSTESFSH